MTKKIVIILCLVFASSYLQAQTVQKDNLKFKRHYYIKKSVYEALPNTEGEILFVGNSITAGGEWEELFHDLRVKNRGISGDVTDGVLFRLKEITESNPDKIFLMIGVNDLSKGKSKSYILKRYHEILDSIKSQTPTTKIFIQSILPVNNSFPYFKDHTNKTDSIISLNGSLKQIAQSKEITFIDLFTPFADNKLKLNKDFTLDGLHLNGKGYLKWAELVKDYIN